MHFIPTLRLPTCLILVALTLLAVRTVSADDLTSECQLIFSDLSAGSHITELSK